MLSKAYWRMRRIILDFLFKIKKIVYMSSNYINSEKKVFKAKKYIFIEILKQTLINLLFFYILLQLDKLFNKTFTNTLIINQNIISDILIALLGIAGVFLGLYCSYIATVFSNKYINAPLGISNLFSNDTINSKSLKSIANFIILSIIMLTSNLLFENLGIVSIVVTMIMAIHMVVSYIYIIVSFFLAKRLDTRAFRRFLINTRQPFRVAIDIGVAACFFALNE